MITKLVFLFAIILSGLGFGAIAQNNAPVTLEVFAAQLKQQSTPQLVDVRSAGEFAINHIPGAINTDFSKPEGKQQLLQLHAAQPVFLYAINNNRTQQAAQLLQQAGFTQIFQLQGGIANWIGSGKPYYSSVPNQLSKAAYQQALQGDTAVLVAFTSRYCGACKQLAPMADSIVRASGPRVKLFKIDINDNAALVQQLHLVHAVPTLVLYRQQQIVWQKTGIDSVREELAAVIRRQLPENGR